MDEYEKFLILWMDTRSSLISAYGRIVWSLFQSRSLDAFVKRLRVINIPPISKIEIRRR
jgi:hypothetical protein